MQNIYKIFYKEYRIHIYNLNVYNYFLKFSKE